MRLTKTNALFIIVVGLIFITGICFLIKDFVIPLVLGVLAIFGYAANKTADPVSKKTRDKEAKAKATIDQIKQETAANQATKESLDDRLNKLKNGVLIVFLAIFIGGAVEAADLFIPKDYDTLKRYYIEAVSIAEGYKALSEKQAEQIAKLTQAAEDFQTASAEKDRIISDLQRKIDRATNRWGPTFGLNSDHGWTLGISQKKNFWGWNLNASPNGSFNGSVTWWIPFP
jgi:hypothetical protein